MCVARNVSHLNPLSDIHRALRARVESNSRMNHKEHDLFHSFDFYPLPKKGRAREQKNNLIMTRATRDAVEKLPLSYVIFVEHRNQRHTHFSTASDWDRDSMPESPFCFTSCCENYWLQFSRFWILSTIDVKFFFRCSFYCLLLMPF